MLCTDRRQGLLPPGMKEDPGVCRRVGTERIRAERVSPGRGRNFPAKAVYENWWVPRRGVAQISLMG